MTGQMVFRTFFRVSHLLDCVRRNSTRPRACLDFEACASALDTHGDAAASREVRVYAAMLLGVCEDGLGRRDRAVASYARAAALMDEVSDYSSYDFVRDLVAAGQAHALAPKDVELSGWLSHVPP